MYIDIFVYLITFINTSTYLRCISNVQKKKKEKKKYPFFRQVHQKKEKKKDRRECAREDDCKAVTRWLVEHAEKDLGFLRIGSLNVRVKRTTEAFSQFLGVATSSASSNHEKIHKSWGSADNVQVEEKGRAISKIARYPHTHTHTHTPFPSTLYNYSTLGRSTTHPSLFDA